MPCPPHSSEHCVPEKNPCPIEESNPGTPGSQPVAILTELSKFILSEVGTECFKYYLNKFSSLKGPKIR
jgi:hypothetical protein